MDLQLIFAIIIGKTLSLILKLKGSGATAAPGLYALKIDPNLVKKLSAINNLKSVVVSGTNGKTTTSRLIFEILKPKEKIIHNRAGSNLLRGVASTLISNSTIFGKIDAHLAIWEADEAALLPISKNIKIDTLVLINLFRDQLDRYGEIDTTRKKWIEVVSNLPKTSTLILNSDDPSTNYLAKFTKAKKVFFGVETEKINLPQIENVADVKYCINCGSKLSYQTLYSAHLGKFFCPKCSFKRTTPQVKATNLSFNPDFSSKIDLALGDKHFALEYELPGLYSVYNVLAAAAVANTHNATNNQIRTAVNSFSAAFGRFQKTNLKGCDITTFLIKNPAGANEVIRTILTKPNLNILAILNDKIADGRDVSWIWDTNWEALKGAQISVAGTRAYDLALRLKYAGIETKNVDTDIKSALVKSTNNKSLIILPTYTAMLELQNYLAEGENKWHKQ